MRVHGLMALAGAVGIGLLTACGSDAPANTDPSALALDGRTFLGDTATVDDKPYDLAPGSTLRLGFDDSTLAASGGCNTMSGAGSWEDGTLRLDGSLATTEMACDEPLMEQDTWFADLLSSQPSLAQEGDTLTLTSDSTIVVLTDEETVVPDQSLTGTTWQLDAITTGESVSSVPSGAKATVTFESNGTLKAFLGCNRGSGNYIEEGGQLTIDELATTLMACSPPGGDVENAMLSVLQGTVRYSIDGNVLVLSPTNVSGEGPSGLTFRAS